MYEEWLAGSSVHTPFVHIFLKFTMSTVSTGHQRLLSVFRAIQRAPPPHTTIALVTAGEGAEDDAENIFQWFARIQVPCGGTRPAEHQAPPSCSLRLDFSSTDDRMPLCFVISPRLTADFIHSGALCLRAQGSSWSLGEDSVRLLLDSLSVTLAPLLEEQPSAVLAGASYTRAEHERGMAHIREAHPTYFRTRSSQTVAPGPRPTVFPSAIQASPPATDPSRRVSSCAELVQVFESAAFINACRAGRSFAIAAAFSGQERSQTHDGAWTSPSALTLRVPPIQPTFCSGPERPVVSVKFDTASFADPASMLTTPKLTVLFDRSLHDANGGTEAASFEFPDVHFCGLQLRGALEAVGDGTLADAETFKGGRVHLLTTTVRAMVPGTRVATVSGNARLAATHSCFHGPVEVSGAALATFEDCALHRERGTVVAEPLLSVLDASNGVLTSVVLDDDWSAAGFVGADSSVRIANGASLDMDKCTLDWRSTAPCDGTLLDCDHATLRISDSDARKAGGGTGSFTLLKVLGDTAQCFGRAVRLHLDRIARGSRCSGVKLELGASATFEQCSVEGDEGDEGAEGSDSAFFAFSAIAETVLRCVRCSAAKCTNGFTVNGSVAHLAGCAARARHVALYASHGALCRMTNTIGTEVVQETFEGARCGIEVRGATVKCTGLRICGWKQAVWCDGVAGSATSIEVDDCEAWCMPHDDGESGHDEKSCAVELTRNVSATLSDCRLHDAFFGVAALGGATGECRRCDVQSCHNGVTVDASTLTITDCAVRASHVGVFVLNGAVCSINAIAAVSSSEPVMCSRGGWGLQTTTPAVVLSVVTAVAASSDTATAAHVVLLALGAWFAIAMMHRTATSVNPSGKAILGKSYGVEVQGPNSTVTCDGVVFGAAHEVVRCALSAVARLHHCTIRPLPDRLREFATATRLRSDMGTVFRDRATGQLHHCRFWNCDAGLVTPLPKRGVGPVTNQQCSFIGCLADIHSN